MLNTRHSIDLEAGEHKNMTSVPGISVKPIFQWNWKRTLYAVTTIVLLTVLVCGVCWITNLSQKTSEIHQHRRLCKTGCDPIYEEQPSSWDSKKATSVEDSYEELEQPPVSSEGKDDDANPGGELNKHSHVLSDFFDVGHLLAEASCWNPRPAPDFFPKRCPERLKLQVTVQEDQEEFSHSFGFDRTSKKEWIVTHVKTPASDRGMKIGYTVISVAGKDVKDLTRRELKQLLKTSSTPYDIWFLKTSPKAGGSRNPNAHSPSGLVPHANDRYKTKPAHVVRRTSRDSVSAEQHSSYPHSGIAEVRTESPNCFLPSKWSKLTELREELAILAKLTKGDSHYNPERITELEAEIKSLIKMPRTSRRRSRHTGTPLSTIDEQKCEKTSQGDVAGPQLQHGPNSSKPKVSPMLRGTSAGTWQHALPWKELSSKTKDDKWERKLSPARKESIDLYA